MWMHKQVCAKSLCGLGSWLRIISSTWRAMEFFGGGMKFSRIAWVTILIATESEFISKMLWQASKYSLPLISSVGDLGAVWMQCFSEYLASCIIFKQVLRSALSLSEDALYTNEKWISVAAVIWSTALGSVGDMLLGDRACVIAIVWLCAVLIDGRLQ